ncbi:MAG: MFS superfamily sulfate permease-like transporter [Bacteroidia bacterium]|jgi:MFS superfamily sulfate permease-like transporter
MQQFFSKLKNDLPAGLVVFLVAVPLCLGIAAVSGVPAFSGLIAGIIGGIVVGALSGSSLGVSGPAAGLAVIIFDAIDQMKLNVAETATQDVFAEAFQMFLLAVVIAGVIQVILGFINGGIIGYYFPSSVIKGMLAGIGLTIFLKEVPHALGYDKDIEGDMDFWQVDGENTFSEILNAFGNPDFGATIIAFVGIAILILWQQKFINKFKFSTIIQGPLVAILAGIGLVFAFKGGSHEMIAEHLVNVPVAKNTNDFLSFFTFPNFGAITNVLVWKTAAVIAVVASLETLLCVEATDKLDPEKSITPTNRELKAQGVGNILSGLIGGLPITQVIVRSSANIQSGGKTKMSAIIHGFFILGFVALLPEVLNLVPRASLAAILLIVGYKLANPAIFKEMWAEGKSQFIPFIVTIFFIIFKDLLWGVGIGLVVAIFEILYLNYKKPYLVDADLVKDNNQFHFQLAEDVTFLHKANILATLNKVPNGSKVIIDGKKSISIHPDVREIIRDFETHAQYSDITVDIINFKEGTQPNPLAQFDKVIQKVVD